MIYIEVIFGSINGNAIDVDSALSDTSTNPVQNKVIKAELDALQSNIDAVAGSITKEVVEVETYDDLAEIEDPQTDVIYVTTDTNKLYLYDAKNEEFHDVTDKVVDNTIYVTDLDDLFDMELTAGLYTVSYTHRGGRMEIVTDIYSLSVQARTTRSIGIGIGGDTPQLVTVTNMVLANAEGYAVKGTDSSDNPIWVWNMYSFTGHTHTTSDVDGLSDELAAKQDAANNSGLNTTDKSIVGAINEVFGMNKRDYAVNFYGANDTAIEHNLSGRALTLAKIVSANVATLSYSILNGAQNVAITLVNGKWQAGGTPSAITIPADAEVTWKVTRVDSSEIAEIDIKEA